MFANLWKACATCLVGMSLLLLTPAVSAQDRAQNEVMIDLHDTLSGVAERSKIAWSCTQVANAAMFAHENNILPRIANEAAKFRKLGSSEDSMFNDMVEVFALDPAKDFLFMALLSSQVNIAYLEEQSPYKRELKPVYTAYLAATCARVSKLAPSS